MGALNLDEDRFFQFLSAIAKKKTGKKCFLRQKTKQLKVNESFIKNIISCGFSPETYHSHDLEEYLKPLDFSKRPAIFVSPHWGGYVQSFVDIACALSDGSKFIGLRGADWNKDEEKLWHSFNLGSERKIDVHKVLEKKQFVKVFRALRGGAKMLFCFDLFDDYGKTGVMNVFSMHMNVTIGWAHLAYKSDALVVFVAPKSIVRDQTELIAALDPRLYSEQGFISECEKKGSKLMEDLISEEPAFWFMWEHIDKFTQPVTPPRH